MTFVYQFGSISEKHPILEMTYVYHFEYISDKITTKIRQKSNKNRQIKVIIVINRLINRLNNELINRQTNELTNILNNIGLISINGLRVDSLRRKGETVV
jgi:hypothetical protein